MDKFPSPHPLTPPSSEEEELAWIRLLRSRRVGVSTFFRLLAEHGSAREALAALPDVARAAGVQDYRPCPLAVAESEQINARHAGARFVAFGSPDYPARLAEIADAPPFLWIQGAPELLARPCVAMVGARNASSLGIRVARKIAGELGEAGFTVISGLARGIDTAAHDAALPHATAAVMAGGVDLIYPRENTVLAEEIARRGVRLSEQPMGLSPQARHFPRRNRLISGLAAGVIVVEAAARSGSLITARDALDQGREVLALPGHPFDARASGCNMLIRDGATLIRSARDVIEALAPLAGGPQEAPAPAEQTILPELPLPAPEQRPKAEIQALHAEILARLGPSPLAEDQLIRDLSRPAASVAPELLALEMEGRISRQPGGLLALS